MNPAPDLILGEARLVLSAMEDESVDAVVTDPPFGIGFKYNQKEKTATPEGYWEWLNPIYREILRVLKKGGFLAVWQTQLYFPYFWAWFGNDIHIYASCKNFVQLRKTPINYAYDPVIMKYKDGGDPIIPLDPPRNVDFFVANTAKFVADTGNIARQHPCPRPVDQVSEIVQNFTRIGSTVLDPFMGSGTTGVACVENGRKFTGIEIDEMYYNIAKKRIESAVKECKKRATTLDSWIW